MAADADIPSLAPDFSGLKVLVVDDNRLCRELVVRWLRHHAHVAADAAADGRTGLERYILGQHDIVVIDQSLPDIAGSHVIEEICAMKPGARKPWSIVYTAVADDILASVLSAGRFDDVLRKPCMAEDYTTVFKRALAGLRRRRDDFAAASAQVSPRA